MRPAFRGFSYRNGLGWAFCGPRLEAGLAVCESPYVVLFCEAHARIRSLFFLYVSEPERSWSKVCSDSAADLAKSCIFDIESKFLDSFVAQLLDCLIFVCLMKRTVPISDIQRLFAIQSATYPVQRAYDFFCTAVEESLRALFSGSVRADALGEWELEKPRGFAFALSFANGSELTPARRLVISAATATANKIYIEKCLEFMELDLGEDEQW